MAKAVAVFGFGSYFDGGVPFNDIDLLIMHEESDVSSCGFALDCKRIIKKLLKVADIVILSKSEENENGFISTSRALHIGEISNDNIMADIATIIRKINDVKQPNNSIAADRMICACFDPAPVRNSSAV
jgi:hypothetical protein